MGCEDHPKGCYFKLKEGKSEHSEETEVVIDYNKKGEILGIEFVEGLK